MLMKQNRQTGSIITHSLFSNAPAAYDARKRLQDGDAFYLYFVQEQDVEE